MTETTIGREPVQVVEIMQPICANTFGSAPCTATGSADTKCYNTRATCQDTANFALDATPLSLFFVKGTVGDLGISGANSRYLIPALVSVSTTPTRINIASADQDAKGIGNRAVCNIVIKDFQHTDRLVDPYVDGRSWNPLSKGRGTFWTRWLVRNRYRQNIQINVYEGYSGQTLAAMKKRTYFLTKISGANEGGSITITGKDILHRLEERNAQAPKASPGELYEAIAADATKFDVAGALTSDYASSGTLRIGDELMTYNSVVQRGGNIRFRGVTRGTDNTTAQAHEATTAVQQCLRFDAVRPENAARDLIRDYADVASAWIPFSDWQTELGDFLPFHTVSTIITEPTPVIDLVSELQEQCGFYLWWDEREREIKVRALSALQATPNTITDSANILPGSFAITEAPRERLSRVVVHYDMDDFVEPPDSYKAYVNTYVLANLEVEAEELYGESATKTIFARWLTKDIFAKSAAKRILNRYVETPEKVKFRMDAKDRDYWTGDYVRISHYLDRNQYGARRERDWLIISAEEVEYGHTIEYEAQDVSLFGVQNFVMANGSADYPGAGSAPAKNAYIGNANGKLSDGSNSARIS